MKEVWYVIYNPISGGGNTNKRLDRIKKLFKKFQLSVDIASTLYPHHEEELVLSAIKKGFIKFICIGGDGTLHHMVNAIMKQGLIASNKIKLAVIPTGTGNDWVKNYHIPSDPETAIKIILTNKSIYQEIGKITLAKNKKEVFFNNAAGLGFDAYTVKKISTYKKYGSLAYLLAALSSFKSYTSNTITIQLDKTKIHSKIFMLSIGICKYSGGGMQLTDFKNRKKDYFNVTILKDIRFFKIIRHILKLYTGKIGHIKEAQCYNVKELHLSNNKHSYIQADGELLGKGAMSIELIPEAIAFIIP